MIDYTIQKTHPDYILFANAFNQNPEGFLRGSHVGQKDAEGIEGHYSQVTHLQYWNKGEENLYRIKLTALNEATEEYEFEIHGFDDYEMEFDQDRSWPASFNWFAKPKGPQSV